MRGPRIGPRFVDQSLLGVAPYAECTGHPRHAPRLPHVARIAIATACGRRDCQLPIDRMHALEARRVAINRLLGYDVALRALDSVEQHLATLLDAALAELRRVASAVAYDRAQVADGDTITLADATETLLQLLAESKGEPTGL